MSYRAMNVIRVLISLFIVVLITVSTVGWFWTGAHQPAEQAVASRMVLTLGVVAGLVGLLVLWRGRPRERDDRR